MNNIGAVSLGWSGTPLPQVFEELAAMGGTCIEINGNVDRHHGITFDRTTIPQILSWAADAGLVIASLSGYCDFAQTDENALKNEIARLLATCEAAADMGVPVVRAFTGDVKPSITLRSVRPFIIGAFRTACRSAAKLGITLGIENHGRLINDGPELVNLVREIEADNLGFTIDTGNFAWAGHDAAEVHADFEAILPYVVNVHIKDGNWTGNGFEFTPAGEGELPLRWLLQELTARGYEGPIYSEYEGGGDFREGTRNSIAYLKETLAEVSTTNP